MKTEPTQAKETVIAEETVIQKELTIDEKITQWKALHGKLYKSLVDGDYYIWRKLKRKEYTNLMTDSGSEEAATGRIYDRQEKICITVILSPENISQLIADNAGLATTLADEVIMKSGFELTNTEEL